MTQNALTPITSNTLAKAEDVMGNFEYLEGLVQTVQTGLNNKANSSTVNSLSSSVSTLTTNVGTLTSTMETTVKKDDVKSRGSASKPVCFNSSGQARECTSINTSLLTAGNNYVVIDKGTSGTSWWRKWNDGRIEQGGVTATGANISITFVKEFSNANYTLVTSQEFTGVSNGDYGTIKDKTKSGFKMPGYSTMKYDWYACGY